MKRIPFLSQLSRRETVSLLGLLIFLSAVSLYFLIAQPFLAEKARLSLAISTAQNELYWFKMANTYLHDHESDDAIQAKLLSRQGLNTILDQTIKTYNLEVYSPSIEAEKNDANQFTVIFAQIPFDEAIKWVTFLWQKAGVTTTHAEIVRLSTPGLTSMRITFKKSPSH